MIKIRQYLLRNPWSKLIAGIVCMGLNINLMAQPQHCASGQTISPPLNVVYFTPAELEHGFWKMQLDFMKAVAEDLGIRLKFEKVSPSQQNRFHYGQLVKNRLADQSVDYVMGPIFRKGEQNLLDVVEQLKIPFISTGTSITPERFKVLGLPQDKYKYWLAHFAPDNIAAGYDLIKYLAGISQQKRLNTVAVAGTRVTTVNYHRETGLKEGVKQYRLNLLPIINTDWREASAKQATLSLLKRKLPFDLVWTVGSDTAAGVVAGLLTKHVIPGKHIKVGTMDWSLEALDMIEKGYVEVSFGGHFMESGWALIVLFDHAQGIDFQDDIGTNYTTRLKPLDQQNIGLYREAIKEQNWSDFDFKQFSKCFNSRLKTYQFDMDILRR